MAYQLVLYEDDSFQQLHSEEERAIACRWRYFLEETTGLYNADIHHVCNHTCFAPFKSASSPDNNEEEGKSLRYVHTINRRHLLFGCPRSGRIHKCPLDKNLRDKHCKIVYATDIDAIHCRFSDMEIHPSPPLYNPYTEEHFTFNEPIKSSKRIQESMRRAEVIFEQRHKQAEETKDKVRGRFDHASMKTTTRTLRNLALRSSAPTPIPSSKRTREEHTDMHDLERERKCATPPPSLNFLSISDNVSDYDTSGSSNSSLLRVARWPRAVLTLLTRTRSWWRRTIASSGSSTKFCLIP